MDGCSVLEGIEKDEKMSWLSVQVTVRSVLPLPSPFRSYYKLLTG